MPIALVGTISRIIYGFSVNDLVTIVWFGASSHSWWYRFMFAQMNFLDSILSWLASWNFKVIKLLVNLGDCCTSLQVVVKVENCVLCAEMNISA